MAIRAGQILHDAEGFVIDRIQTAGVGNVNIPEEKIYELGNFLSVGTVRDIPDLSFDVESLDVSTEIEALLTQFTPDTASANTEFDFADAHPIDIISPFKSANNAFDIIRGIAIPYLTLERSTYRFGLRQNSTQQHTLRGDSIFYIPGTPYYEEQVFTGAATYSFANTAIKFDNSGTDEYALGVHLFNSGSGTYTRVFQGDDYTDTAGGVTFAANANTTALAAAYDTIALTYGSLTSADYTQTGNTPEGNPVHQTSSVKPATVRGKDIDVYIATPSATETFTRWSGVQSFEVTRSVNIENDEEFGNNRFVDSGYDVADVTGSITVKPENPQDLFDKIYEVTDVPTTEVVGPNVSALIPVELRVSDPDTGSVLKTLYVPDAKFTVPGVQGRVQTKLEVTFNFTSEGGSLLVYEGSRT
jgi:hypothetical protein